jgi:hypothetical protein
MVKPGMSNALTGAQAALDQVQRFTPRTAKERELKEMNVRQIRAYMAHHRNDDGESAAKGVS